MGPKSLIFAVVDGRGAERGRETGSTVALGTGLDSSSAFFESDTGDCSKLSEPRSLSKPSNVAKEAKSVSLSGGAGAEGEIVAFKDMLIGGRPDFEEPDDDELRMRVGAVDPPVRRGSLLPPDPPISFFVTLPLALFLSLEAAVWAAFLFFLSMAMLCPGRIWASAHLWPNLQFPLTNQVQTSFCWPGSWTECEKGQDAPAVHPPTLKNLHGTCDRSFADR
jgi:hypothetical protein